MIRREGTVPPWDKRDHITLPHLRFSLKNMKKKRSVNPESAHQGSSQGRFPSNSKLRFYLGNMRRKRSIENVEDLDDSFLEQMRRKRSLRNLEDSSKTLLKELSKKGENEG